MNTIGVCYLVRGAHGVETLSKFLDSYTAHPAGIEHDLVLIFKGFSGQLIPPEYLKTIGDTEFKTIFAPERGFDIGTYFFVAKLLDYEYLCFLNSYSVIISDDWLVKMFNNIIEPGVGIVGATGSYQSFYSYYLDFLENPRPGGIPSRYLWRRLGGKLLRFLNLKYFKLFYDHLPNYHIRTNAFMVSRRLMLSIKKRHFWKKSVALKFESGKKSLTKQICALGLRPIVVGRDGRAYEKESWYLSRTFRGESQDNLLIADNRTEQYEQADKIEQRELRIGAWGRQKDVEYYSQVVDNS